MSDALSSELQTIVHRGGVVEFSLPAAWSTQYGDQGGGTFWNPNADGGTLRLDLLTFDKGGDVALSSPRTVLESFSGEGIVKDLPNGNAVREYYALVEEDGEKLKQFYWEVANFRRFPLQTFTLSWVGFSENAA